MASWVLLEVQCRAGTGSAGGQQLCHPGTGGKVWPQWPLARDLRSPCGWLSDCRVQNSWEIDAWYTEVGLKDPQIIYSQIIHCIRHEFGSYFSAIYLVLEKDLSQSPRAPVIQNKGRLFLRHKGKEAPLSEGWLGLLSHSKFFPLIKLWWHIRQILDRLADLFFVLEYNVILLWSSSCGNCLFIENWIYFEILIAGYTF